jgi:ribosomal protein L34
MMVDRIIAAMPRGLRHAARGHSPKQSIFKDKLVIKRCKKVKSYEPDKKQRKVTLGHQARTGRKILRQRLTRALKHYSIAPAPGEEDAASPARRGYAWRPWHR